MSHTVVGREIAHSVDLIFHQGYQRRNHYGGAFADKRRQLISERLSAAGRHQHKHIVPLKERCHYLLLVAFVFVEAEMLLQGLYKLLFCSHGNRKG